MYLAIAKHLYKLVLNYMEISNRENNACIYVFPTISLYICVNAGIKYVGLGDDDTIVSYHHDIIDLLYWILVFIEGVCSSY